MLKILKLERQHNQDYSHFRCLNFSVRLTARPIPLWKFFYWGAWGNEEARRFAIQSPWISIAISRFKEQNNAHHECHNQCRDQPLQNLRDDAPMS